MVKDPYIIRKREGRDGVDAFGLYVDYVLYRIDPDIPTAPALLAQERFFLVSNMLCSYHRKRGNSRASWKMYKCVDHDAARARMLKRMAQFDKTIDPHRHKNIELKLTHEPLLIELSITDVEALKKGETPYARFTGTLATEKATGKINDTTWKP